MSQQTISYREFERIYKRTHVEEDYNHARVRYDAIWKRLKREHNVPQTHRLTVEQWPASFHVAAIELTKQWTSSHLQRKSQAYNSFFQRKPKRKRKAPSTVNPTPTPSETTNTSSMHSSRASTPDSKYLFAFAILC